MGSISTFEGSFPEAVTLQSQDFIKVLSQGEDALISLVNFTSLAGGGSGATWNVNIVGQPQVVSQAEAEAGTATSQRIWTAQRVAQAIAALIPAVVSQAEAEAGVATISRFWTAERVAQAIAALQTFGATWGVDITGQPAVVSQAEAEAGVATTERIWTAERVAQAIDALAASATFQSYPSATGITASITHTQGQQELTSVFNEVATVANQDDVVTLTQTANVGRPLYIEHNGVNRLQIFPWSTHNIVLADEVLAADAPVYLEAGGWAKFIRAVSNKWIHEGGTLLTL